MAAILLRSMSEVELKVMTYVRRMTCIRAIIESSSLESRSCGVC